MKVPTLPTITEEQWEELYKKDVYEVAAELSKTVDEVEAEVKLHKKSDSWEDKHMELCLMIFDLYFKKED